MILRQDNARFRLADAADRIGVLPAAIRAETRAWESLIEKAESYRNDYRKWLAEKCVQTPEGEWLFEGRALDSRLVREMKIRFHYRGYIEQEKIAAERAKRDEAIEIPSWLDYDAILALRYESREKLKAVRPETLAQASRIPGVNPADVAVLAIIIKRGKTERPE